MSDLSLLNKLFECYLMLCSSESIIKKEDKFSKCVKRFACVRMRVLGYEGEKRQKRLVEVGNKSGF